MTNDFYFDNTSTTRPSDRVISSMMPYFTDRWGIPSSPHSMGQSLLPTIAESYKAIYSALGAKENDLVVLTSSGAEAVNHAIFSVFYDVTKATGKNHFVTSMIDEAPAIMSISRLEQLGCKGKMIEVSNKGFVTAQNIADNITPRTVMVSLSWANGLTGVINPISDIAKLCQERGIILHIDATHVLGKLYFDLQDIGADFISFNGANLHGPKGTGALYIRDGRKFSPFITGGLEQAGQRAGDVNVPGLVGLGEACREIIESREFVGMEVARLRDKLENGISQEYPEAIIFFKDQERLPNISAIGFPGITNEAMLYSLNRKNVFASMGGGNFQQIGLVLEASGIASTLSHSAISFSLSRETQEGDVEKAITIIVETAKRLKRTSQQLEKDF